MIFLVFESSADVVDAGDPMISSADAVPPPPLPNDAPRCTRSMRELDPCSLPFSLGSYKQSSPGGIVVNPAPAFLIRSLSCDDCRYVAGPRVDDIDDGRDANFTKVGTNALTVLIAERAIAMKASMKKKLYISGRGRKMSAESDKRYGDGDVDIDDGVMNRQGAAVVVVSGWILS